MNAVISSLGNKIDCFIGPCDSLEWRTHYNVLQFEKIACRIAVPRKHRLAKKSRLRWSDLDGETLMLVKRDNSAVLDRMRDDILKNHPSISIADAENFYDTSVFNECERMNYLMETLDIWKDVHPALLTLPVEWNYEVPYGIIYAKKPDEAMREFIGIIQNSLSK